MMNVAKKGLLIVGLAVVIALIHGGISSAYNAAQIDASTPNARSTYINAEANCYNTMRANRAAGMAPRPAINAGGTYFDISWISLAGQGSQQTIEVEAGTRAVSLQLNSMTFLCSSMVSPDGAGADYSFWDGRVLRSDNFPNDRAPNPMGGNTNWPARTGSAWRINSLYDASGLGSVGGGAGGVLFSGRQEGTRYWFASPIGFSYTLNNPSGFTQDTSIHIVGSGTPMAQYYFRDYVCQFGGNAAGGWNYGNCGAGWLDFWINIRVKAKYSLTPRTTTAATTANVGDSVTFSNYIDNTGPTTAVGNWWGVTSFVVPAGNNTTYSAQKAANGTPFTTMFPGATNVNVNFRAAAPDGNFPAGTSNPFNGSVPTEGLKAGDRLCATISVGNWATPNNGFDAGRPNYYAKPACVRIIKNPQIQIRGADSWSGGYFPEEGNQTQRCLVSVANRKGGFVGMMPPGASSPSFGRGSWSQYGLYSLGTISLFGSAGATNTASTQQDRLLFANVVSPLGNFYKTNPPTNCLSRAYEKTSASVRPSPSDIATASTINDAMLADKSNGTYVINPSGGQLILDVGSLPAGKKLTLIVNGDVRIAQNFSITGITYANMAEVPSLTLIAYGNTSTADRTSLVQGSSPGHIIINDDVERVDATLVSYGNLVTCSAGGAKGSDTTNAAYVEGGKCSKPLTIGGGIVARQIIQRRTYGAGSPGTTKTTPSEIYDFRPDTFLAPNATGADSVTITTMSERELPPRY